MLEGHGRCLCGKVRYEFDPETVIWQAHCHCDSCRRACSAPMATFFAVPDSGWRWTGAAPAVYASSPGVQRYFCGTCGSPMGYRNADLPGEIHGYAASLDRPEHATPDRHDFLEEKLPWMPLAP